MWHLAASILGRRTLRCLRFGGLEVFAVHEVVEVVMFLISLIKIFVFEVLDIFEVLELFEVSDVFQAFEVFVCISLYLNAFECNCMYLCGHEEIV